MYTYIVKLVPFFKELLVLRKKQYIFQWFRIFHFTAPVKFKVKLIHFIKELLGLREKNIIYIAKLNFNFTVYARYISWIDFSQINSDESFHGLSSSNLQDIYIWTRSHTAWTSVWRLSLQDLLLLHLVHELGDVRPRHQSPQILLLHKTTFFFRITALIQLKHIMLCARSSKHCL